MNLDATITMGNIIEIAVIGGGGIMMLVTLKSTVSNMKSDLTDLKAEIKKLSDVMVDMAEIRGDIKGVSNRVAAVEQDVRDLRHGHGFVQRDVNGEYPRS